MKVQKINVDNRNNVSFNSANKLKRYGISTLIASTSLFMYAKALDSFEPAIPQSDKPYIQITNLIASILGIAGIAMSSTEPKKDDDLKK